MTTELVVSYKCNLGCGYCYQNEIRDAGNYGPDLDLDAAKATLAEIGGQFTVFGGEPLLTPIDDLEEIFRHGVEQNRKKFEQGHPVNGIQTNGVLITDEHIELFKRYGVSVGISIDGPGELNDARWRGSEERTREATAKTEENIRKLIGAGITPSLIVTLHNVNAGGRGKRDRLKVWFKELEKLGIRHVNLHSLEVDNEMVEDRWAMDMGEYADLMLELMQFERDELSCLGFRHTQDKKALLRGEDGSTTCTYNACDPFTTAAVQGVDGAGNRSNCGRTYKDGVTNIKAEEPGYERYLILKNTPMEDGGCKGCRFFVVCKGHCPGESESGDWRSKTKHCPALMVQFEFLERAMMAEGKLPITRSPELPEVERRLEEAWENGENPRLHQVLESIRTGQPIPRTDASGHGDHWDDGREAGRIPVRDTQHGDSEHGDSGHGDVPHGDYTDHGDSG